MLRAGGRRVVAAALPGRSRGPHHHRCGCLAVTSSTSSASSRRGRVRPLSTSSDSSGKQQQQQAPHPQPPPGAKVVAKQVRTDQRGYKATLYYTAAAAEGGATGPLKGTCYGKVAPPKDAASLQVCVY